MQIINDVLYFLFFPGLVLFAIVLTHRGAKRKYKIVKETNTLGETKFEVWFNYYSITGCCGWLHEKTFDTEEQANAFIASQFKTREVIREGNL